MKTRIWTPAAIVCAALLVAACGGMPMMKSGAPDTVTGSALWEGLKAQDYQKTWKMWPGKGALYQGREPHGALLTTYVNATALEAIEKRQGTMPAGAIVVKENYTPDRKLAATTVMWKVPGYNPAAGDWFWAKYAPTGAVQAEGKVDGCIRCHGQASGNDYLFTGSLK